MTSLGGKVLSEPTDFESVADPVVPEDITAHAISTTLALIASSAEAGIRVETAGHDVAGDGGGASYNILTAGAFTGTVNSVNKLLANGNIAELIHNGTIHIEQAGVLGTATYSDQLNDIVNTPGITRVLSSIASATFDKVAFIDQDNVTVDLSNTLITYVGDYDVYAQFGIGTDRSIGFINSRGVLGTTTTTVTSAIVDGTTQLTLASVTGLAEGDYIELDITYPRRTDEQVALITDITGLVITIDYTFGWIVTSCVVTKIDTMRTNNHINLNLFDNSAATADANKISGIGFQYSANCSASWKVENHNFPAMILFFCQDVNLTDGYATLPKDITSGRGYNCQLNNSNRINATNLVSRACRHNWDSSGSSFCTLRDSHAYAPVDNISQYTTHGIYEHDILIENCSQHDGQNAFSVAQSGAEFGSHCRRFSIIGGRYNGLVKSENATQFLMENVEFYGTQSAEHEFALTEGTIIRNVKFNDVAQIRITIPNSVVGTEGIPSVDDSILFEDVDFNDNLMRTTNVKGAIKFVRCKNFGLLTDSDLTDYPISIAFEDCAIDMVTGWELKPIDDLIFEDCAIDLDVSLEFSAGVSVSLSGGSLTSSGSARRIKFDAPVVQARGVRTTNTTGIFATDSCKVFNLIDIVSTDPDATHSSNQFSTEGTTDCIFIINGMNVQYTGSGNTILFINTGLNAIITGSYIEGAISHSGATTKIFAGNITPDVTLP